MQIIENRTRLTGNIESRVAADQPDFDVLHLKVGSAEPVEEYADLLSTLIGESVEVLVRKGQLGATEDGAEFACVARRTSSGSIVAEPERDYSGPTD